MGRPYHRWTPEEIQFLKDIIAGRPYADFREMFDKSFGIPLSEIAFRRAICKNGARSGLSRGRAPLGKTRVTSCGYVEIKRGEDDWPPMHRVIWEAANGRPVPEGHTVIFADGNRSNFAIDNLLLVSRGELGYMNRNRLVFSDRNLTRTGRALAALELAIAERERELGTRRPKRTKKAGGKQR
jgi:hypothetical protein